VQGAAWPIPEAVAELPKGRRKLPWLVGGAALLVAAVTGGLIITLNRTHPPVDGRTFAQYYYKFVAPSDWAQTGDNVADKQVVIRPVMAQAGDDLVVVQEFSMDFDATADRQRLVAYLKGLAQQNPAFSNFTPDAQFAGKSVIYYRQTKELAKVDWYVSVQGKIRIHGGCQYAAVAQQQRVSAACEQAVRTLMIGN
jgi:type VII secretion-associated protein (TIGR03931 family)